MDAVGSDFVNLTWDKAHDGGGRLSGYFIEKMEVGSGRWSRVNFEVGYICTFLNASKIDIK